MKNNPSIAKVLSVVPIDVKASINEWLGIAKPDFRVLVEVLNDDHGRPVIMLAVVNVAYCSDEDDREEMLELTNDFNQRYRGLKAVISRLGLVSLTYRITYCCQDRLQSDVLIGLRTLRMAFQEIQKTKQN